uniref:MurNAc alpha-1-phosphate uridylyltransferase n=1 Tax=Candidatus Kentrum sp. MB TaxID=2138164 RepID=A0A451BG12_9GAMM|nr:MAG: MurNAc alpha-1-phosphate uridylyltransferase [Candidatus Kentron sp. MB]
MKVLILAAGRGERMRPLTDTIPKPLLPVGGQPLIARLIRRLAREGFGEMVINLAYLGEHIEQALGDGRGLGVCIRYSRERAGALDTGGGVRQALPLLGEEAFLVVNGDVWTDYPFSRLAWAPRGLAHVVLTPNPPHNPQGDFGLVREGAVDAEGEVGRVSNSAGERLTFSGVGVYRPALFRDWGPGRFPLAMALRSAVAKGQVTGERYAGDWRDVGTLARLQEVRAQVEETEKAGRNGAERNNGGELCRESQSAHSWSRMHYLRLQIPHS